jgi:SAM-dependent methyltransferase
MPRDGELTYYDMIGEGGRHHAVNKPFSDGDCGTRLMQVGSILSLLPPPPLRVLDCGCGTGWLSWMLQKRGYDVVGIDVSPRAIELALAHPMFPGPSPPTFEVGDVERMPFDAEFDAVLFLDSLHHAVDEQAAIDRAYRSLKRGGLCIASETAPGHEALSQDVVAEFDVTEKDMPPSRIIALGRRAGFRRHAVYPRADDIGGYLYAPRPEKSGWLSRLKWSWAGRRLAVVARMTFNLRSHGFTVLYK